MKRFLAVVSATVVAVVMFVVPVSAHNEFDPEEAAPGSIVDLTLVVENESSTAGIVGVEVRFPEPLVLVVLPTVEGWTAEPVEGSLGEPAIGIKWTRPSAPGRDDPRLGFTVGPLPDRAGQLQFKVLQTYSDGRIDRWIEDWPEGQPEPTKPGPVLRLVAGAAGTIPTTTVAASTTRAASSTSTSTSAATPTTVPVVTSTGAASATTTSAASVVATTVAEPGDDSGSSRAGLIAVLVIVVIAAAGLVVVVVRRRAAT